VGESTARRYPLESNAQSKGSGDDAMTFWTRAAILLGLIGLVFVLAFTLLFTTGCPPPSRYPGRNFQNVTLEPIKKSEAKPTPAGILLIVNKSQQSFTDLAKLVDTKTTELEACLQKNGVLAKKIRRDWFGVYIPKGWYVSTCSKEQLIPSRISYKLCEAKKHDGEPIKIEEECRNHTHPTEICPCVCNVRAAIHYNFWVVTTPNFKLFKAELARLVTNQNNPWTNKKISSCLK
jgi:hypothetical protein